MPTIHPSFFAALRSRGWRTHCQRSPKLPVPTGDRVWSFLPDGWEYCPQDRGTPGYSYGVVRGSHKTGFRNTAEAWYYRLARTPLASAEDRIHEGRI